MSRSQAGRLHEFSTELADLVASCAGAVVALRLGGGRSVSGIVWRPGYVVSAAEALDEEVAAWRVAAGTPGEHDARLLGRDPSTDIALLGVDGLAAGAPPLADPATLRAGQLEGLPVVVLMPGAQRFALQALHAGARGVLGTEADAEQIAAAVMSAFHGLLTIPAVPGQTAEPSAAPAAPPEPLTPREIEILGLLAAGDSNKTIAARLSISVHTVKFHISSILAKLGVASRTEAVALGLRLGIILL
jgi:DNA-binding NarL/FixJ family response regulator